MLLRRVLVERAKQVGRSSVSVVLVDLVRENEAELMRMARQ